MLKKSFVSELKQKLGFLESYGFVLGEDPCNPGRPCYKNGYGEICIWTNINKLVDETEIYVQINGWKKVIDVRKEYKKYLCHSSFGIPLFKAFKELFRCLARRKGDFFGIKITTNNYIKFEEVSLDKFKNAENPFKTRRIKIIKALMLASILIFLFIQTYSLIFLETKVKNENLYFITKNILWIMMLISHINIIILLRKELNKLSMILLGVYPIIGLITLYEYTKRMDYIVYNISFIVYLIYLIINLLILIKKRKRRYAINGLIPFLYPFFVVSFKSMTLDKYVFYIDKINWIPILIAAISLGVIASILGICFKPAMEKDEYVGYILAIFCTVSILSFMTPLVTVNNIDYSFDQSVGEYQEFLVVDKYDKIVITTKNAIKSYYLIIDINGEEKYLNVEYNTYSLYEKNDYITLIRYDGFYNLSYYELENK